VNNRTIITIALLVVVMILGMANAVNVTAVYDSDENNNVSPCESCSRYQANGTFSEERANDTHARNVSLGSITNLTGSVCDDEVLMKVNITSPVRINESTVDLSVTNDNTTVATAVIRDGAAINRTASTALASSAFDHGNISTYTGAGTCMVPGCHGSVGENFTMSIHNTWLGIATNVVGKEGNTTGKLVGVNAWMRSHPNSEHTRGSMKMHPTTLYWQIQSIRHAGHVMESEQNRMSILIRSRRSAWIVM
jgi:hypothetical protein